MVSPAAGYLVSTFIATACFVSLLRAIISLKSVIFFLARLFRWAEDHTQAHQTFTIPRHANDESPENPLYRKAAAYVAALPAAEDSDHTSLLSLHSRPNDFSVQLIPGQTVLDWYLGARLSWTFLSASDAGDALVLRLRRQDRHRVLRPYLRHVETVAEEIELRRKEIKFYTHAGANASAGRCWRSVTMSHPATFDTLVMDPELKARVRADLELFLKGRSYYARMGRVWKRSYFLYGPPGTGKSSFVAAMARYLCYNVYDLDLSRVSAAGDLRSLLLDTSPRSVILVEDLDRYLAAATGEARISGLLSFMDGVFSCCGEERIMVFTANGEKEAAGLDPVVVRPGRVDFQIHFPRCDFMAFKTMAGNYLGVTDHKLYAQVEEGFQSGGQLSHAELGEIMMANRCSPSRAIKNVISALQRSSSLSPTAVEKKELCGKADERIKEGGREFRKLYGLIRMQSWSKKERRMPAEINGPSAG